MPPDSPVQRTVEAVASNDDSEALAPHVEQAREYYAQCLKLEEPARQVSWRSRHDQELRFENLLEAIDERGLGRGFSVLDVGCGLGDLWGYLRRSGREVTRYLGVDVVPEMVSRARRRHPEGRFEVRDILAEPLTERFDLVVCSGSLTVRVPAHERFVQQMLVQMCAQAELAVAVNFQSTRAYGVNPEPHPALYHADPLRIYGVCRRICRWTALREDMLATDFTVYLYPGHSRSVSRYRRLPTPPPAPAAVGWLLLERRLPEQALEVLAGETPSAEVLNLRGMACHQMGRFDVAEAHYTEAVRLDADYTPARLNLKALRERLSSESDS